MASLVEAKGKTRSTTGRMIPSSMRDVISANWPPFALMKRNEYCAWWRFAFAMQDNVVVTEHVCEVLLLVIDHDVGPEASDQLDVGRARGRRHRRADVLRQLNGKCAHTTRAGVDENFLSWFQTRSFDQHLPRGQADQGDGGRFFHAECFWFDRHVIFFDCNELRECTDSPVSRPRIDFVAGLESTHSRSDPDHDPGRVMTQNEREAIRQNALELAVSDFGIQ